MPRDSLTARSRANRLTCTPSSAFLRPAKEGFTMLKMKPASRRRHVAAVSLLILFLFTGASLRAFAQPNDPDRALANKLYEESKYAEALPLLEKLAEKYPEDPYVLSRLGFTLYVSTAT